MPHAGRRYPLHTICGEGLLAGCSIAWARGDRHSYGTEEALGVVQGLMRCSLLILESME